MTGHQAVQKTPPAHSTALVAARGWVWTRLGQTGGGTVQRVRLAAVARDAPDLGTLLTPYDRLHDLGEPGRARKVSRPWLRHWVANWPATAWPVCDVVSPADLAINLVPHQLSPVLAVVHGASTRLLLADGVGQGKTVEAGVLVRELAARGAADRVLVLTPLTLRDQWREELGSRCDLEADVVDRAALRARDRATPSGVSPFLTPGITVVSLDLAKQPDLLARLSHICWDVLVIDEAHGAAGDSARAAAAAALGARSRVVLLLTATPHAGDAEAFARLCAIGRLPGEPPPLLFRHRPDSRDGGTRQNRRDWSPRRSVAERACSAALGRYVRRLDRAGGPAAALVALLLRKRALSSPAALATSLRHRIAWLERRGVSVDQPCLPFDEEENDASDDEHPAVLREAWLPDAAREAVFLAAALEAAELATGSWSKVHALRRLLKVTHEPVLVFTEYRDTLFALSAALSTQASVGVLHGGCDRAARASTLARFCDGQARVLLATDVAAEGLNLQHACRLVVHVELPWSPARLEQREGRVDRLGQTRRVHVWRLLGDPLHESRIVAALSARLARMRASGVDVGTLGRLATPPTNEPLGAAPDLLRPSPDYDSEGATAALRRLRQLVAECTRRSGNRRNARARASLPWRPVRPWPGGLPRGVTVVCLLPGSIRGSRPELIPVHVAITERPPGPPSRWLPDVASAAIAFASTNEPRHRLTDALRAREQALLSRAEAERARVASRWQGSLFERRTARIVEAVRADAVSRIEEHQQRLTELADGAGAVAVVAVLALLVE